MSKNLDRAMPRKSDKEAKKRKSSDFCGQNEDSEEPKRLRRSRRSLTVAATSIDNPVFQDENTDPQSSPATTRRLTRRSRVNSIDSSHILSPNRRLESVNVSSSSQKSNKAAGISGGQSVIGQLNDVGIKTRLRRRFRVPETDTRLGSDGDSIRGSIGDNDEYDPSNVVDEIDIDPPERGERSKRLLEVPESGPSLTSVQQKRATSSENVSELHTVLRNQLRKVFDENSIVENDSDEVDEFVKNIISKCSTADTSSHTPSKKIKSANDFCEKSPKSGGILTDETSTSSKPCTNNKRKKSNNSPHPKILKVVDCGVRSDGTVCRCYRDVSSGVSRPGSTAATTESTSRSLATAGSVSTNSARPMAAGNYAASSILRAALMATRNRPNLRRIEADLDLAFLSSNTIDVEFTSDDDSDIEENSDPESMYDTTIEDIDSDLALNSPPDSRLHRCLSSCPIGCRGNLRPSEIIIFESKCTKRLLKPGVKVNMENPINIDFKPSNFKKIGGRGFGMRRTNVRHHQANCSNSSNQNSGIAAPTNMPQRVALLLETSPVTHQEALKHTWNPQDRSFNVRMSEQCPFTIRRQPVAQSTDSARTIMGYSSGLHIFELTWPVKQRGTHSMVGVATDRQILHSVGYSSLIGLSDQSWGWDLIRMKAFHNSAQLEGRDYPAFKPKDFNVKKSFHLVLDCDAGTLGFIQNGVWLGVAHNNLKNKTLYPTVSSVWGHCEVKLRYHGGIDAGCVPRLMDMSKVTIKTALTLTTAAKASNGSTTTSGSPNHELINSNINKLPISGLMKTFLIGSSPNVKC